LLPPSMPRRQRFETLRDAETRNLARIEVLANRGSAIAEALSECDAGSPCDLPACARCARRYRIYFTGEALAVADAYLGPHEFATIFLDAVEAGSLPDASLKRTHAALRKRLDRCGFRGSVLVGGTEAAWIAADRRWILHLHLLAIGVRPDSWERLRAKLGDYGHAVPLKIEALNDEARQLSYITKFTTYHRPLKRGPGGPSPAFPLPPARLEEWWTGGRTIASRTSPSSSAPDDGEVALRWRSDSILSALTSHDRAELTGAATCFSSPDGVSAAVDSRRAIRFDRVSRVGGRRRSAPSPATSTWPTGPPCSAIGSLGVRPNRGFAYPPTCPWHQSHHEARADSYGITSNSRKQSVARETSEFSDPQSSRPAFPRVFRQRRRHP
jgi:hypothetical protein